jgi:hypothetical protein
MSNAESTTTITIRIPTELADRIKALADKDVRSTNGEVIYILRLGLDALDQSSPE